MEFARLKNFQLHSNRLNGTLAVELDLLEEGLVFFVERRKKVKMKENVDVESMNEPVRREAEAVEEDRGQRKEGILRVGTGDQLNVATVPRIPAEWTVVKILNEYKKSKLDDADSYKLLENIIPMYMDEHLDTSVIPSKYRTMSNGSSKKLGDGT
ncbi:hypothetical protein B9Z55_026342 [Caenorhabditis nigoni]|uniref:MRG domain-containing protein n=1 Tax=Caenorhabditis nigoni TaxID=1611254 RepID=A0A2G5T307_9PELO|nr:hypothetical protein B9Z55_026342 [Caenorhabditis nigoni]